MPDDSDRPARCRLGWHGFSGYKGNESRKYTCGFEARRLSLERQPAQSGKGFAYICKIENGPGQPVQGKDGAVKPRTDGDSWPESKMLRFVLQEMQAYQMAMEVMAYYNAYLVNFFNDIRAAKVRGNTRRQTGDAPAPREAYQDDRVSAGVAVGRNGGPRRYDTDYA